MNNNGNTSQSENFNYATYARVNELIRSSKRTYLDLRGEWEFRLDPETKGENEKWYATSDKLFSDTIMIPGCLEAQGKGLKQLSVDESLTPGWTRNIADIPYEGASWYHKKFSVPKHMQNKEISLQFGGISPECKIWLNGVYLGEHTLSAASFKFNVTTIVKPGEQNDLTIRVFNPTPIEREKSTALGLGVTTGFIHWAGIYRGVELIAYPAAYIEDIWFSFSNNDTDTYFVEFDVNNLKSISNPKLKLEVYKQNETIVYEYTTCISPSVTRFRLPVESNYFEKWDVTNPHLYTLRTVIMDNDKEIDELWDRIGFRHFTYDTSSGTFLLNGTPTYLRGEMVHYHWANTISPQTDREDLHKQLQMYVHYGFNFLRCHSFLPHPEFLDVCDELGLLVHSELEVFGRLFQCGTDKEKKEIWNGVIHRDRNHPSVVIWCLGNEKKPEPTFDEVQLYVNIANTLDGTRLVQTNSPGHFVLPDNSLTRVPIAHEVGKWASYIDSSTERYYKGAIRPWLIEYAKHRLKATGQLPLLNTYIRNSNRLQDRCRKIGIEEWRLHEAEGEENEGYEFCTVRDCGNFVWGILDDFCNPKDISAETFLQSNNDTVLLLKHDWRKRSFTSGESLKLHIWISHYGKISVADANLTITIDSNEERIVEDTCGGIECACGTVQEIGSFCFQFPKTPDPKIYEIKVKLTDSNHTIENRWPVWVFPDRTLKNTAEMVTLSATLTNRIKEFISNICPSIDSPSMQQSSSIVITSSWEDAKRSAGKGRRVLLVIEKSEPPELPGFHSSWVAGRSEHSYHATIIHSHPLLDDFPHDGWCDIPFMHMINGEEIYLAENRRKSFGEYVPEGVGNGWIIRLDTEREFKNAIPIISGIPCFKDPTPVGTSFLFEIPFEEGTILVTSFQFLDDDPAGMFLFSKMLHYLWGKQDK